MRLILGQPEQREIVHYASGGLRVSSLHHEIFVDGPGVQRRLRFPRSPLDLALGTTRLARRALRLDKCNVVPIGDDLVAIRQGQVFHWSAAEGTFSRTLQLRNCRCVLHQSVAVVDGRELFFGEYGRNPNRREVPVYRSLDGGRSWRQVFAFPAGRARHVHGCQWDPVEERVWVFTGDLDGECQVLCADREFRHVEWIGDGRQAFRACSAFFEEDAVHWIMDSQLEGSYHVRLDRKRRTVEKGALFPGPVWYIKRLADGYYLAATAHEVGPGVRDGYAHLLVSRDLDRWEDVHRFVPDDLPHQVFKDGVIGFADGEQTSQGFYLFFEAIRGLDGRATLCRLEP